MPCDHKQNHNDISEKSCIDRVPLFAHLTPEEKFEVSMTTSHRKYKKGETIYLEGERSEKLFIINKGSVKIFKLSESGKEQIIRILNQWEFMGELSIFTHSPITNNAEALEETTVCIVDGKKIGGLIETRPNIAFKIISVLSARLEKAENMIESLGLQDVEQRLADILLKLSDNKDVVELSISKRDLASHIGMTQETLSRKLSSFQSMGLIKLDGQRKIHILNREALRNMSPDKYDYI